MLNHIMPGLSAPSTCGRDQGMQHLVASTRAVPFLRVGRLSRIEVVGIPALKCQVCDEQIYDVTLLAHIESALRRRVKQGDVRTLYAFEQLATELMAGALPSEEE
jgi:hypothetical protein